MTVKDPELSNPPKEIDWQNHHVRQQVLDLVTHALRCPSCGQRGNWRSTVDIYPLQLLCTVCEYVTDAHVFRR